MKKLVFILAAAFSFSSMANTTLVCNDQNSHADYILRISSNRQILVFSPITKDSSTLSKSKLILDYNEGESNEALSLFAGRNADKNIIIVEVRNKEMISGKITEVDVYYTKTKGSLLDQKTLLLCGVKVDNRAYKSEKP